MLQKLTPVLFVDSIEQQLPFWIDTLGFTQTVSVPEDWDENDAAGADPAALGKNTDKLGFVILARDQVQIMLQTWISIEKDIGWKERAAQSFLFIEVDDIDVIEQAVAALEKIFPRRDTFYGATEIGVRDPAGNLITFAQFHRDS